MTDRFSAVRTRLISLVVALADNPEGLRKEVMGHESLATTQWYTHLAPVHERAPPEQLSAALPLVGTAVENRSENARSTTTDGDRSGE